MSPSVQARSSASDAGETALIEAAGTAGDVADMDWGEPASILTVVVVASTATRMVSAKAGMISRFLARDITIPAILHRIGRINCAQVYAYGA
jgi:hypothetical protein